MLKLLVVIAVLANSVSVVAGSASTTLEGTLVASNCYLPERSSATTGNEMGGRKECGSGCLEAGNPGGLLTNDHAFYLLNAPSLALAPFVGQQIRVSGEAYSKDIFLVRSAAVKSGGGWESIDLRRSKQR